MIQVGNNWDQWLAKETEKKYFKDIEKQVKREEQRYVLYPRKENRYRAFALTSPEKVKVVLCGDEPFAEPNRADGLAFSSAAYDMPFTTNNLFRKIQDELHIDCYEDANLERWAKQGVFLLNISLVRRAGGGRSSEDVAWSNFTFMALKELYQDNVPKVFIFLGSSMDARGYLGESDKHLVLLGGLPSTSGFFFRDYFKQTQDFLYDKRRTSIDWR